MVINMINKSFFNMATITAKLKIGFEPLERFGVSELVVSEEKTFMTDVVWFNTLPGETGSNFENNIDSQ